jgi:hypothetical protein
VVYGSSSLALAAMETFVNLEPLVQPKDLVSIECEIPDELEIGRLNPKNLPVTWHESRDESLHRFGDEWIRAGETVALLVPSAAVHGEWNVLLNPAHADFQKVKFGEAQPFEFDARLFRGRPAARDVTNEGFYLSEVREAKDLPQRFGASPCQKVAQGKKAVFRLKPSAMRKPGANVFHQPVTHRLTL